MEFMKKKDKNIKSEKPLDGDVKISKSNSFSTNEITDTTILSKEDLFNSLNVEKDIYEEISDSKEVEIKLETKELEQEKELEIIPEKVVKLEEKKKLSKSERRLLQRL